MIKLIATVVDNITFELLTEAEAVLTGKNINVFTDKAYLCPLCTGNATTSPK